MKQPSEAMSFEGGQLLCDRICRSLEQGRGGGSWGFPMASPNGGGANPCKRGAKAAMAQER